MMREDVFSESCGALIYHAKQMRKYNNVIEHLIRAKGRILTIENSLNLKSRDKKAIMPIKKAAIIAYDKIPVGSVFSGTKLAKQAIFLTGRLDAHKDSVMRKLRELRQEGKINYVCIDCYSKSMYQKL
jgi:hypothetical protein